MAKRVTTKGRRDKRRVRDLAVKSQRAVRGGETRPASPALMLACATGQHYKGALISV